MIFQLSKEDIVLIKSYIKPNLFVITKGGLRKVIGLDSDSIIVIDKEDNKETYDYSEIIPLLKGFKHIKLQHLFDVVDIIRNNTGYQNYKPNFNFLPNFIEITDESIELKVQIFSNFDIIHCDNLTRNLGTAYHYLTSNNYDVYGLHKKGLAIIDSDNYETRKF